MEKGIIFSGKVITEDDVLESYDMVNLSFKNEGATTVVIDHLHKMLPSETFFLDTSGMPLSNEQLTVQFEGTGTKKLVVSFGKLVDRPCECN